MPYSSWPAPSGGRSVNDAQYEALAAAYSYDGLISRTDGQTLCYGDSSGLKVSFRIHSQAVVRGHMWDSGASVITIDVDANPSGQIRTDLVVLRLDRSTYEIAPVVRKGTPGAGAPAFTQTPGDSGVWEIPVARVQVAASASTIGGSDVTVAGWYLGRGEIVCTSTTRPPHLAGLKIFETDTTNALISTGSSWVVTSSDTGWINVPITNSWWTATDTAAPIIRRFNGVVYLRLGDLKRINGAVQANDDSELVTIPEGFRDTKFHRAGAMVGTSGACSLSIYHSSYTAIANRANKVFVVSHPVIPVNSLLQCEDVQWPL